MNATSTFAAIASTPESRALAQRLVRTMVGKSLTFFADHERTLLQRVRDHLLELADNTADLTQSNNIRSAAFLLKKQESAFLQVFRSHVQREFNDEVAIVLPGMQSVGKRSANANEDMDGLTLSLIDVDDVNRILLQDRVSHRFNAYYEDKLEPLTQRLSALFGTETASLSGNPFRPEIWIKAFAGAWKEGKFDDRATDDLLDSLQPKHTLDFTPLYAELTAILAHAGVTAQAPRIRRSTGMSSLHAPLSTDHAPLSASAPAAPAASAWGALAPVGRSVASHARTFLQRLGVMAPQSGATPSKAASLHPESTGPASDALYAAADPALLDFLGQMQAGTGSPSHYARLGGQEGQHHNVLRAMRDQDEVRHAPELDRGTVDALAEVFDYVFADQAIPMQMKMVIGRLQIPVLKAAMIDRDFFLSEAHPARKLVDTLATASVAWAPEKGEADPLYVRIEKTVQRVLHEFEDDLTLFSDLLLEFTEFLFETEQQAQAHIEPVAVQEQSKESLAAAQAHADDVIHECLRALPADLPLAPFLTPFLSNVWREVLAHAWLMRPEHPAHWVDALTTMDQLIWSTQPKSNSEERNRLVVMLPNLVRNLNTGLDRIQWDGEPRAKFTRRLIATHMFAIRMKAPVEADSQNAALEVNDSNQALAALDQRRACQLAERLDDFDAQAQTLTRGHWFEVTHDKGTSHRCRLSWVSPMRTRFLFTNREGFDAFVRSEREVAAMLRAQQLQVLEQAPIVARALNKLMAGNEDDMRLVA